MDFWISGDAEMSPHDAIAYGLSRQRELLSSKRIDDLVNAVTVTDGSAQRKLADRSSAGAKHGVTIMRAALAGASRMLGRRVFVPHPNAR
jgi:hypothetical protein